MSNENTSPNNEKTKERQEYDNKSLPENYTCTACETKLTVVGEGKAKHTVATHKCAADVPNPATCCASN